MADVNAWDDENFPVSLYIQEPYDPTKIPMYCKDKVYCNGMECEYSLEEIRARRYGYENNLRKNSGGFSTIKGTILPATSACRDIEVKPLSDVEVNARYPKENTGNKNSPIMKAQIECSLIKDSFKTSVITAAFIDKENQESSRRAKILLADVLPSDPISESHGLGKEADKENMQPTYETNYLDDDGLSAFDATSYTKAFNAPIPSSTPFIGDRVALKFHRKESDNLNSANENTFIVPPVAPIKELSVIEESSKEMIVGSIGTTPSASTAESGVVTNPSGRSYSHSVHGSAPQTSSVVAVENVTSRKTVSSFIPIPVVREHSKESVRTSQKETQCIQKLKESTEEEELCNLMSELILSNDPFDHESNLNHLKSITLTAKEMEGFVSISCKVPVLKSNSDISLRQDQGDGHLLKSLKLIGQGAYAKVYKAFSSKYRQIVAVKLQKPACEWEFYISRKIHERIQEFHMKSSFMEIKEGYRFLDGSLFIYDYMEYGSLLNIINLYKMRGTKLPEVLALYFTINLLKIISCLHSCHIIHGDIKPDNFLLRKIPSEKPNGIQPSLQLIDLGRCIDMSLYPEGACFSTVFQKSHFQCVEMRTKRPWSYQLDLFGAASVVHCLVFGEFMEIHCKNNIWSINKKVPRNMNQLLWNNLFEKFLNISSCNKLPNIGEMIKEMQAFYFSELANEMGPAIAHLKKMLCEDCAKRK